MAKAPAARVEKKQVEYGSDVVVDLMKAFDIEYAAFNPGATFYNSEEHGIEVAKFRQRPVENAGIGTHVDDPVVNFAKVAEGFGVHAEGPIQRPADLRPALQRALKVVKEKKLPALVDVVAEPR